jgi:hypothetical protein
VNYKNFNKNKYLKQKNQSKFPYDLPLPKLCHKKSEYNEFNLSQTIHQLDYHYLRGHFSKRKKNLIEIMDKTAEKKRKSRFFFDDFFGNIC